MAMRELSSTLKNSKFMQRGDEKAKKEEEVIPVGDFPTCQKKMYLTSQALNSLSMDVAKDVLEQQLIAPDSSTLTEVLEHLIETAKTSNGRLELASKHILVRVLELCQMPLKLSSQALFLSIKLLRNLCAGEKKNQNLFIEQNGVQVLSTLISSMSPTYGSDIRVLHMALQVLGNVSLAGAQHQSVVWCQFFPLGFVDIARVQSKETCDTLSMVIYTCFEGSNERFADLLTDPGLDIVSEIIRTSTAAGFREDWVRLLLSKICFEASYFSSILSKLSLMVEAENSDDNESQINHFSAEQAFLLSILSEILNELLGDVVVSNDFSLCIFGILRTAVRIVDFSTRGKLSLPTGSADIDVMGYTLSFLRDISACDNSLKVMNQDEKGDALDMLVSDGLIKFLITLLRNLEPPPIIKKAMASATEDDTTSKPSKYYYCPYKGFRRDIVAIIGNCSYRKKHVQDEIREQDGILLLLQQCVTDEDNPFLREWGIWLMRNVFDGNLENQQLVTDLELQKSVDIPEIADLGLRVEVDPETRRPKLVNVSQRYRQRH